MDPEPRAGHPPGSLAERRGVALAKTASGGASLESDRWLAYSSDESGRSEIHLRSFTEPGEAIPVSRGGGFTPTWRADGRELYYWSADGELTAVTVDLSSGPSVGEPEALFGARLRFIGGWSAQFAASPDGQRFLLNRVIERTADRPATLLQNWASGSAEPE